MEYQRKRVPVRRQKVHNDNYSDHHCAVSDEAISRVFGHRARPQNEPPNIANRVGAQKLIRHEDEIRQTTDQLGVLSKKVDDFQQKGGIGSDFQQ